MWFAGTSTPNGWIAADGNAVSRTTYATLFAVIGTTYGTGNGSTTFNVPNVSATTGAYYIRFTTSVGTVTTTALSSAPVGTMMDWPTTSSYPTGWLRADGTNVSRTTYADLFSLIGTTYGTGDGLTTFTLPNLPAAGSGSPVKIIKATLSGITEPSTVAHAASHQAGGSDVISIRQSQIMDFVFTNEAARDASITSPVEGMRAYLTSPTSPAATGGTTFTPSGIQTIYNGNVWVCVTPIGAYTADTGTRASASAGALTGGGTNPTVTLVTGTTALIHIGCNSFGTSGNNATMSYAVSGASTIASSIDNAIEMYYSGNSVGNAWGISLIMSGLTAGTNTFTLEYSANTGTASFRRRRITVQGIG
jgi:microcystin-dependent protein